MKRIALAALLLLLASTGCLEVDRVTYVFDVKTLSAVITYVDIRSDGETEDKVTEDFDELMGKFVNGTKLETDNPGWNVQSKKLYEVDGKLMGKVAINFRSLDIVGVYQHDKRSPYIFCDSEQTVLGTTGTQIQDVLKGCVAWDRKSKQLEVSVGKEDNTRTGKVSLLKKWQATQG